MTVPPEAPQPGWSAQPPTEPYAGPPPASPFGGPPPPAQPVGGPGAAPSAGPYAAPPPTQPYAGPPPAGPYAGPPPAGPSAGPYAGPYAAAPAPGQWAGQWSQQPGAPVYGPRTDLASWGQRVGAMLIDTLYELPALVLYVVGIVMATANAPTTSRTGRVLNPGNTGLMWVGIALLGIGVLGLIVISVYNRIVVQGRSGQSWGKRRLGLRLQHQDTGQIIGIGNTFLRQLCHAVDGFAYVGYLWPLWDPMRQTFADKIMRTVVIRVR